MSKIRFIVKDKIAEPEGFKYLYYSIMPKPFDPIGVE